MFSFFCSISGSGYVDYPEFENIMKVLYQQDKFEEDVKDLRQAFRKFDKDKNGILDRKEFSRLLKASGASMTKAEVEEVFSEVDSDNSGGISIEGILSFIIKVCSNKVLGSQMAWPS